MNAISPAMLLACLKVSCMNWVRHSWPTTPDRTRFCYNVYKQWQTLALHFTLPAINFNNPWSNGLSLKMMNSGFLSQHLLHDCLCFITGTTEGNQWEFWQKMWKPVETFSCLPNRVLSIQQECFNTMQGLIGHFLLLRKLQLTAKSRYCDLILWQLSSKSCKERMYF